MERQKRHERAWAFLRFMLTGFIRRKFRYESDPLRIDGPFLLLCNHNTDWDALLVGLNSGKPIYFVASEHMFRWGLASRIIRWLLDPIPIFKGSMAANTVLTVMRRLRNGQRVCIFAEGNRSWNGVTMPISKAIGKLAKSAKVTVVTYRLEGGYLAGPRWGDSLRRGPISGRIAGVYSPDRLRHMSQDEVNRTIARDLHENAFARQKETGEVYKGKNLAQHLERTLFTCPGCMKTGTLKSSGDRLYCGCGVHAVYLETGFFAPGAPFDSVYDWDAWQSDQLRLLADEPGADELFSDSGISIFELTDEHAAHHLADGPVSMFADRLETPAGVFPLADITGMSVHGPQTLVFSSARRNYEIKCGAVFCARKYESMYSLLILQRN